MHVTEIKGLVEFPEGGLLIGNGDFSVSIYNKPGNIVWRFGKSDVWDRRLDSHLNPPPATIKELSKGIAEEWWKCPAYGGEVVATLGTDNPQRMKEVCQPTPSETKPYPMPKPVGELSLRLHPNLTGLNIVQRLFIEEARIEISCSWDCGTTLVLNSFIHPVYDVLVTDWNYTGDDPLFFSLYRWADPSYQEFEEAYVCQGVGGMNLDGEGCKPLDRPYVSDSNGTLCVEQAFPPDPLFENGFKYRMTPHMFNGVIEPMPMPILGEARLKMLPDANSQSQGHMIIHISTSLSEDGVDGCFDTVNKMVSSNAETLIAKWRQDNLKSAQEFWSKSSVIISDKLLESVWYETLHAQRCIFGKCLVPPGLMLPSTLTDYVRWHGDYHSNYNFQQPFWGLYTANHLELAESYYKGIDFFVEMGRIIAEKYYKCRGTFIQLSAYPIAQLDDCLGCCPMGRMVYMTGWAMHQYWWHYLYSQDKDFLKDRAYPVIRDCAAFYGDFLKKEADGFYHAFPSNVGEDGFSGKPDEYRDRAQIMQHINHALTIAIAAANELDIDADFVQFLQERLDNLAPENAMDALPADSGYIREHPLNPPEFGPLVLVDEQVMAVPPLRDRKHHTWSWYFGKLPYSTMALLRTGRFDAELDFKDFRGIIDHWRKPNGLLTAMAASGYGHTGAWSESLGITAPIQEMLLQSWTGTIEVFPAWPKNIDAEFTDLRTEGAFLVSAKQANGQIESIQMTSEKGQECRIRLPWKSARFTCVDSGDSSVVTAEDSILIFATIAGATYQLTRNI